MSILRSPRLRGALGHPSLLLAGSLSLLLIVFTLLRISGTSVGAFNEYVYGAGFDDPDLLWGQPRGVRGDEWLVTTSMTAAQAHNDFAHFNPNIGLGEEMSLISDAPTKHWSTLFKPHNWSFFVLPLENAIAFKWWFRGFALIFAAFLLFQKLLTMRKQPHAAAYAAAAALILYFTPFVQWWYSTSLLEARTYCCLSIFAVISILEASTPRACLGFTALLAFSLSAAAMSLYPPFLVPLGLLSVFLLAGYVAEKRRTILRSRHLRLQAASLLFAGGMAGIVLLAYYLSFADVLKTMQATVYPGNRVAQGGSYSLIQLLSGSFDFLLLHSPSVPAELGNQSEAANALFLFPWLVPGALYALAGNWRRKEPVDFIFMALLAYAALMTVWLLIGLPRPIERVLLLDRVPPNRGVVGLVLANLLLIFLAPSSTQLPKGARSAVIAAALCGAALLLAIAAGYKLREQDAAFVGREANIWLGAVATAVLCALLLLRWKAALVAGLLAFSLFASLQVNPLYRGLGPLTSSPILTELAPYHDAEPDARWVVYDGNIFANYLLANGYRMLNGVQVYPQFDLWTQFDPDERYLSEWNRFAHVLFALPRSPEPIEIESQYLDSFTVFIDPCDPLFETLDVDYFIFAAETAAPCLQRIAPNLVTGWPFFAYERVD